MLRDSIFKVMLIVCLVTSNLHGLKGLLLCGDLGAAELYGPEKICCNSILFERVDVHNRARGCCCKLYYTDFYDCVEGMLMKFNPPRPLSTALNRPMEKEENVGTFVRTYLIITWETYIRPTTQTETSRLELEDST